MTAILVKALADLRRRRLQAAVIFLTVLFSMAAGTMAMTLMSQTRDPYQAAFEKQEGAHLQVAYNVSTDLQLLRKTPTIIGASASGGPYPASNIQFRFGDRKFYVDAVGRANPGGSVEILKVTSGRWPLANDEIVLTRSFSELNKISVGNRVKVTSVAQTPTLTVVGEVVDIDEGSADLSSQRAWVLPAALPALATPDSSYYLMDYRFGTDPTSGQLQSSVDRLRASLPPGSITGSLNYLLIRSIFNITNQILTGVLAAFSIFALAATIAIVATLVTGIVISAYREIGIMKAIGFTPYQVVGVFALQIVLPALAACLVGIPVGTLASQPLLANSSHALGLAYAPTFSIGLDLLFLVGGLLVVAVAATVPALRAGLLKPVAAIAKASAPRGAGGRLLRQAAARARLPRPVVLGIGDAFARPLRAILTLVTVLLGVATVVVAVGLPRSFELINNSETGAGNYQVVVTRTSAYADSDVMRLLNAQPETARVVAVGGENVAVPRLGDPVNTHLFRGDSSRLGYMVIAGRWFSAPGEVLAPAGLLHDAHLKIGDSFTGTANGQPLQLRVVGEVYDINNLGHSLFMDLATMASVKPAVEPFYYDVTLAPGADASAYVRRIATTQPDLLDVRQSDTSLIAPVKIIDLVLLIIAGVLALIGVGGVFNTLLLNTRERIRDTATLKALGMSPRQVIVMVGASAALLAMVGGLVAMPLGLSLHHVLNDVISSSAGNDTPPAAYGVFNPLELVLMPLLGVVVAMAAALVPGRWAAGTNVVEVLHAE
ncbi:MAG: FtsX-like permease family protein [Chloroflexi bacterium]|nr:MAG: FtsX-like permease family protein [Chloroflexota bacterium]TMF37091.1 MAG: FtsX-like permease family protein [Chloroflexota bacterium]